MSVKPKSKVSLSIIFKRQLYFSSGGLEGIKSTLNAAFIHTHLSQCLLKPTIDCNIHLEKNNLPI